MSQSRCRYDLAYKALRDELDAATPPSSWVDGVIAVCVSGFAFGLTAYAVWYFLSPVLHRLLP
jgi:hypothetical protein